MNDEIEQPDQEGAVIALRMIRLVGVMWIVTIVITTFVVIKGGIQSFLDLALGAMLGITAGVSTVVAAQRWARRRQS